MSLRNQLKDHYQPRSFFDPTKNYSRIPQRLVEKYKDKTILDVGAGNRHLGENVITLDRFSQADISADALSLPIKPSSVEVVVSIAVLEHLKEPTQAINEMNRVLKKDGEVYLEIPFLQPFHASPNDFYRATLPGLKHWCRNFKELESGACVGPGSAVAWIEIEYLRLWFRHIPILGITAELLFRLWALPLKFLDYFLIKRKDAHITASAVYFHGKKV